jgi:hypothetical protein
MVGIALCFQCGGAAKSAAPAEVPGTEAAGDAGSENPSSAEKKGETSGATEGASKAEAPKKKSCTGLAKSECAVTQGCGWNTLGKGKCVQEGATE